MKSIAKSLFLVAMFLVGLNAQTVSGQVTSGPPPQQATASRGFKKIPKLTATLDCPGVAIDATGNYLVIAGSTATCQYTVNLAPTVATTIPSASTDTTQFTVPASVPIAAGALTSAAFQVTATP